MSKTESIFLTIVTFPIFLTAYILALCWAVFAFGWQCGKELFDS